MPHPNRAKLQFEHELLKQLTESSHPTKEICSVASKEKRLKRFHGSVPSQQKSLHCSTSKKKKLQRLQCALLSDKTAIVVQHSSQAKNKMTPFSIPTQISCYIRIMTKWLELLPPHASFVIETKRAKKNHSLLLHHAYDHFDDSIIVVTEFRERAAARNPHGDKSGRGL